MHGLLLCDDLIFISRITGTATALGCRVTVARSVDRCIDLARQQPTGGVLVDLDFPDLDIPSLLKRLAEIPPARPRVVAYGSHVDAASLRAARAAGCDLVLPRSKFVEDLPARLPEWLTLADDRASSAE